MFPDISCDDIFRLETARLWMRWLRASDSAAITAICCLPDVAQMTASIPYPYPPGEAERFILQARGATAGGEALILAVTTKNKTRTLIGIVSAQSVPRNEVEVGYIIAPAQAGRGYASEALAALVDATFDLTTARALVADTRVGKHPCDFFRRERADWSRGRTRRMPGMAQQRPPAAERHDRR